jgi:hypothetical protein
MTFQALFFVENPFFFRQENPIVKDSIYGFQTLAFLETVTCVSEPVKIKIVQDKRYKNEAHDNKGTYGNNIQFIRKEEPATLHVR